MDERQEDLLNRELDGETTPSESAELRRLLQRDPELRARYEGLTALVQALARVKHGDAPAGLMEGVLQRIARRPAPAPARPGWLETLRAAFSRPPAFRYAFVFASGLALGILASALAVRSTPFEGDELAKLTGAMLPDERLARLEPVSRERLELEGVTGEATTRAGDGRVLAFVRLDSAEAVDLRLAFDRSSLAPLAFQQSGAGRDVALGPDGLRLTHAGRGSYSLLLEVRGPAPGRLRLELQGGPGRLERTLAPGGEGS